MAPRVSPTWGNREATPAKKPTADGAGRSSSDDTPPARRPMTRAWPTASTIAVRELLHRGPDDVREAGPAHEVGLLGQRRVGHPGAVRHQEDGEDRADEVGRRGASGGAQHVVAAGDALVEGAHAIGDAVTELEVASQLADAVAAVLDGGGGVGSGGLEAVEGALHLVEHEVGDADTDGRQRREREEHRRHPPDVGGQAVDDRVEEHRGGDAGGGPRQGPVGGHEHASGDDQPDDGAHDGDGRLRRELQRPPLHGPRRGLHPAVPYRA